MANTKGIANAQIAGNGVVDAGRYRVCERVVAVQIA